MGIARGLERRLERLVDGLAARLFRGRIHPVELGTLLVREADAAVTEIPGGWAVPNVFAVTMGGEPVDREVLDEVETELAAFVEEAALDRGWRLDGPARVVVAIDPSRRPAEVTVDLDVSPGEMPVWVLLRPMDGSEPIPVSHNRSLIGRSSACDIHLPIEEVSRTHAVIWREAGSAWIGDLESSNGTFLNGERIDGPAAIVSGDLIAFGKAEFVIGRP